MLMIKKIFIILIILINTSCSFKNVVKHHGVHFLEKKQSKLIILESNTNDIKNIRGLLVKKDFYNLKDMNKIDIAKDQTNVLSKKDTFVRTIISTLRQKINDPLGKRQAK